MMSYLFMALFWVAALLSLSGSVHRLIYIFFATLPFGSFAVIPTALTGGLSFTPVPILGLILVLRVALTHGGIRFMLTAALTPHRMTLLFLFLVVAVITTLFMPRIFAGDIQIVPFRGIDDYATPLFPSKQNISQLAYVMISVLAVVAFAFVLRKPEARQHALHAVCLGAAVTIATGLLDYLNGRLPLDPLLSAFRTATYAFAVDVVVFGSKRVVGLMPESSAYGSLCMAFVTTLYFFRRAVRDPRMRDVWIPILILLLIVAIWQAKSTAAYVGLAITAALAATEWAWRASRRRVHAGRGVLTEFWLAFSAGLAALFAVALVPTLFDALYAIVEHLVLDKSSSSSFEERGMWRTVAWNAFLDSALVGVGIGSTRASSAIVSTLASVGLLGAVFYYGFILQTALRAAPRSIPERRTIIVAFRWWLIPGLIVGFFIGTVDFGLFDAFVLGLVTAVGTAPMRHTEPAAPTPRALQPLARHP